MNEFWERSVDGLATHALVIGIGRYPHAEPADASDYRVTPLKSAPASARVFNNWLINRCDHLGPPLASVRLLLAEPGGAADDDCTLANIQDAFDEWYDKVNQPDASALVFFSGHGFYNGRVYGLAADFARRRNDPFANVIAFNDFYDAMEQCAAYQQLFFIDCCQGLSQGAIDTYDGIKGSSLLLPQPSALQARRAAHGVRGAYRVFATSPGVQTQGDPDGISDFTTILLDCLKGRAAQKQRDGWWVTTRNLQEGLEACASDYGWSHLEAPDVRGNRTLKKLHRLDAAPHIPLRVQFDPPGAGRRAHLYISDAAGSALFDDPPRFRVQALGPLPAARDYTLSARFSAGDGFSDAEQQFDVLPPVAEVEVDTTTTEASQ